MIVVSDASPLNVLVRIGLVDLLSMLFANVLIPPAVEAELTAAGAPPVTRHWMDGRPAWLRVQAPAQHINSLKLGAGETEAISLAMELHATLLLVDDKKARRAAVEGGLRITGVAGVLELAATRRLVDLPGAFARLQETDFRVAPYLLNDALARHATRRSREIGQIGQQDDANPRC